MTITVNSGVVLPLNQGIPESQPVRKTQTAGRPEDLKGAPGSPGTAGPVNAGGAPALPPPNLTAVDMMLQLTALMSKVAEMTTATQEETIKNERVEMKLTQEKRMAEMKVYYEKMAESSELNTGFFARMVRAASCAFRGDMNNAMDQLGHAFTGNVGTAITIGIAVLGCATPVGPLAGVFLACALLEDEACTFEVIKLSHELAGVEFTPQSYDQAKTTASVFKWIGTGAKIAVGVGISLVGVVASVAAAPATGGASLIIVPAYVAAIMGVATLPTMVESTVRGSQATMAQAEGWDKHAEADKTKAETENMMGRLKSNMTHLQDVFDNLHNLISSLTNMMRQQQQGSASAAQAV